MRFVLFESKGGNCSSPKLFNYRDRELIKSRVSIPPRDDCALSLNAFLIFTAIDAAKSYLETVS